MKTKYLTLAAVLLVFVISCTKQKTEIIEVYHFRIMTNSFDEVSDTIYLSKRLEKFGSTTYEVYAEHGADSAFRFAIAPLTKMENQIIYFEDTCKLLSTQEFQLTDQNIKIFKYYYDRVNSADEESYIFYNPKVGLIAIHSLGWFGFDFFNYKSTKGLLEKFMADTSGFIK